MSTSMLEQVIQGAVLSATSNILAQVVSAYKDDKPFTLDPSPILKFALFSILSNPPNILWQSYLEDAFPTNVPTSSPSKPPSSSSKPPPTRRSTRNILLKFLLDQTLGALVNNLMFLAFMGYTSTTGAPDAWTRVADMVRDKLVPIALDGYKFWPAVSLAGFLWVPVDRRVLFGGTAGILWGVWLGLMVG